MVPAKEYYFLWRKRGSEASKPCQNHMKIIIASEYHYLSFKGGNEQHAHQLALGLLNRGHQVTYLSTSDLAAKKVPYAYMRLPHVHLAHYQLLGLIPKHIRSPLIKADILHVFGFSPLLLQLSLSFKKKLPTLITYQADTHSPHLLAKSMSHIYHRLLPLVSDGVTVSTKEYQYILRKRWPQLAVWHIPLMIPSHIIQGAVKQNQAKKLLNLDPQASHILCVAALSKHHYYKGIEVLLVAAQGLPQHIRVHCIGGGDRLDYFRKLAKTMSVSEHVFFHGIAGDADMASWYQAVDLCVLPSTSASEGFGLSLLEAMYCKTPCLTTTAIGPAQEYQKLGLCHLVEPNNPQALSRAMQSLIKQGDSKMVKRAKQWADTHTPEAMTQKTISVYEKIQEH